jgi:hypothetical protein
MRLDVAFVILSILPNCDFEGNGDQGFCVEFWATANRIGSCSSNAMIESGLPQTIFYGVWGSRVEMALGFYSAFTTEFTFSVVPLSAISPRN